MNSRLPNNSLKPQPKEHIINVKHMEIIIMEKLMFRHNLRHLSEGCART